MPDTIDTWDKVPVDDGNSWDSSVEVDDYEELPSTEFPTFPDLEAAEDDLVYWTRDKSLILVANAIRAKTGTTEKLSWPIGYRNAIRDMSGGAVAPVEGSELMPMFVQKAFSGGIVDASGAVSIIKRSVFANGLEFVEFPSATTVELYAFASVYTLRSVSLPMVTSINQGTFSSCYSLSTVTTAPINSLGSGAFYMCSNLESLNVGNVTIVPESAFYRCEKLPSFNFAHVTKVSRDAFRSCYSLSMAIIPNLTSLDSNAFACCSNLKEVQLGDVSIVGSSAFEACWELTSISGSRVERIYQNGFRTCKNFSGELYLPLLKSVSVGAFENMYKLEVLNAPMLSSISGGYVFRDCYKLRSIIQSTALQEMLNTSAYLFAGCSMLTFFDMPNLRQIGASAFQECGIISANFPSVSYIGNSAFYSCDSLISVSMPEALRIESKAFCYCGNLVSVNFPKVSYVGDSAFTSCSRLTTATFGSATTLSVWIFDACPALTDLYLPGSTVCTIANIGKTGIKLHVPASLQADYYSRYSARFTIMPIE